MRHSAKLEASIAIMHKREPLRLSILSDSFRGELAAENKLNQRNSTQLDANLA